MPIGPGSIAAIYGAAALTSAGVNAYSQGKTNKKTRKWNEHMYERQLGDNERLWNMQNEYNDPKNQMARLKAAGLNPNLVYGDGATAMSKSQPAGADIKGWNPEAPKIEGNPIGDTMLRYYDVMQQKQTIDNLKTQNDTMLKEQELKSAQTIATLKQAGYTDVQIQSLMQEIDQKSKLNPISLQAAEFNVNKTTSEIEQIKASTKFTTDSNVRAEKTLTDHLKTTSIGRQKTAAEIKHIAQQIINLVTENKQHEFEVLLNSFGMTKTDALWQRLINMGLQKVKDTPAYKGKGQGVMHNIRKFLEGK